MEEFYKSWFQKEQSRRNQRGGDNVTRRSRNDSLKLIDNKGSFKRQKLFRLQDHLFHFKIVQKKANEALPLLSDIYDFLHAALLHVLESIKTFYEPEDHNIAYLTLHQEPMINGLNTGTKNI